VLQLYFKLQGYFGYENDRTHVIKVVVLVVKITIQLTHGIHGFKKRKSCSCYMCSMKKQIEINTTLLYENGRCKTVVCMVCRY